jgi:hypothetical protein
MHVCADRGSGLISYAKEANIPTAKGVWPKWSSALAQHSSCCTAAFVLVDKLGVSDWFPHHCLTTSFGWHPTQGHYNQETCRAMLPRADTSST